MTCGLWRDSLCKTPDEWVPAKEKKTKNAYSIQVAAISLNRIRFYGGKKRKETETQVASL